jgi:hypothetical protein
MGELDIVLLKDFSVIGLDMIIKTFKAGSKLIRDSRLKHIYYLEMDGNPSDTSVSIAIIRNNPEFFGET